MTDFETGVLYLAVGAEHCAEALASILSLRTHNPDLPVLVLSDRPELFGEHGARIATGKSPFKIKVDALAKSPFPRTLFLDSDTLVRGSLAPIFVELDQHDLCLCRPPLFKRDGRNVELLEYAAPTHYNTGVIAFKSSVCSDLFKIWAAVIKEQDDTSIVAGAFCDQFYFNNHVIATSAFRSLSVGVLDNRIWNLRCYALGRALDDGTINNCVIVHSHRWESEAYFGIDLDRLPPRNG